MRLISRNANTKGLLATILFAAFVFLLAPADAVVSQTGENFIASPCSVAVRDGLSAHITGRKVTVQPGSCWVNDRPVQLKQSRVMELPTCDAQLVSNERLEFRKDVGVLNACIANRELRLGVLDSCVESSVVLTSSPGAGTRYTKGKDYNVNSSGVITKVKGGALTTATACYADYKVNMHRVDTVAVDETGNVRFALGKAAKWAPVPPAVPKTLLPLYNIYSKTSAEIGPDDVLAISGEPLPITLTTQREKNREALKNVRAKLEQGKTVKIAFWGDSITAGTGASSPETSYVSVFTERLKQRYPRATIIVDREGLVNANTAIRGTTFYQDVLAKNPDLVVIEFVNDMLFPAINVGDRYIQYFKAVKLVNAEVIAVAPHLPATNFIGERGPNGNGSMTYTEMLRKICKTDPNAAFCDVAKRWEHLSKEGLKRESLLVDGVHPSDRGHETYATELIKIFD